jgi:transposase-like protein
MLGITYKSAWFMTHRIREALKDPVFANQLGGKGRFVEADETYWGNKGKQRPGARGFAHKEKIFSLVERNGDVRSFHVPHVTGKTLKPIIREQIDKDTHIVTDDMGAYKDLDKEFDNHSVVCHSQNEYVRGPIHTNTIENYFSILKRGLVGVYQHVGPQHLKRYIGEFDFRYNHREITDAERRDVALIGIEGKRLTYRGAH